jgi:hypothetical protein
VDQRAGGFVILGDPAALAVEDRVDGDRGRRGGSEGGFCGLRGDVSTVDSFDKGCRINGLIAGVRVVLRIGRDQRDTG